MIALLLAALIGATVEQGKGTSDGGAWNVNVLSSPAPAPVVQGVGIDGGRAWNVEDRSRPVVTVEFDGGFVSIGNRPTVDVYLVLDGGPVTVGTHAVTQGLSEDGGREWNTDSDIARVGGVFIGTVLPIGFDGGQVSANVNQIGGAAVSTAASGIQKVGIVGNAGAAVDAANNAAAPANAVVVGLETIAQGSNPTVATTGNVRRQLANLEGAAITQECANRFSCLVALGATALTQCQAAPAAGLRNYVWSCECSNGAATVQGVDVVFGTGSNCATSPTALTHKYQMGTNALTTSPFQTSITGWLVPTAATAICVRPTAATSFGCTCTGCIAP